MNPDLFSFTHPLALNLTLEADGQKQQIVSGNLEKVTLDLHSYGFSATVQFSGIKNEELYTLFNSEKPIKAELCCLKTEPLLDLKGIVVDRRLKRVDEANSGLSLPIYLYQITFHDPLAATWNQHFPINIYVDKSMKDVIEGHKNPEISLKYDLPALETTHPIIAFSLPHSGQISFCSFLWWYLHQQGAVLIYDYQADAYTIAGKKEGEKGEPFKIGESWITPPESYLPQIMRFSSKTIKHTSLSLDTEDEENENGFKSVRQDTIEPSTHLLFPEHAFEEVKSEITSSKAKVQITPRQFDGDFHIDKLLPNAFIKFFSDENAWSSDPLYKDIVFRSRHLTLQAEKIEVSDGHKPIQNYRLSLQATLEPKEETIIERPPFSPPIFPFSIQGTVFSDVGDKEQSTFKISETESHPQGHYLVKVPLAGEDQKLIVPFTPDLTNGQFYFPFTKGQPVLLSVYFHTAKIERILDWQPLARLPSDVQGNQIVLSSNGKDKYAILRHEFEEGSRSVITLQQATSDTQMQTVLLKEKDLCITVDLKDEKTLTVRLNIDEGVLVALEDKASKMTQTLSLDGKQMTQQCKNESDTSTIVQKPDSIAINCKNFTVSSEKVVFEAKDAISLKASSKVSVETPITDVTGKINVGG